MKKTVKIEHCPDSVSYPDHAFVTHVMYKNICKYLQDHNLDWDGSAHTFTITTEQLDTYEGEPLTIKTCEAFGLPKILTCHILEMWPNPRAKPYV